MKRTFFVIFIYFKLGFVCFGQDKPTVISCNVSEQEIKVSEIFSSIDVIKLQTPKESLLTYPAEFEIVDDNIIIFDGTRKVYIYKTTGEFVRQIGRVGKGPGEYIQLADVFVDRKNHLIEILEDLRRKIFIYDFNGNFIKENTGLAAFSFGKDNDGNYLFFSEYYGLFGKNITVPLKSQVLLADPDGRILSTFGDDFKPLGSFIAPANAVCIKEIAGSLIFNPQRSCTIYKLSDTKLVPYYMVDFGEKNTPSRYLLLGDKLDQETYNEIKSKYITEISGFWETNSNVYYWFHIGKKIYHVFYNKKLAKAITVPSSNFKNDLAFVKFYSGRGVVDNKLVTYIPAIDFKSQMDQYIQKLSQQSLSDFKNNNAKIFEIYQNTKNEDNPIIIIYNFKK